MHEDQLARGVIAQADLSVALEGDLCQPCPSSGPLWCDVGMLEVDVLLRVAAGKDIVKSQVAPVEVLVELLGTGSCCRQAKQ